MRGVPGFADDHLIAAHDVNMVWAMQVLMEKHPKQLRRGQDGSVETLHCAIATALAEPSARCSSMVTRPVMAKSAEMTQLNWRSVVAATNGWRHCKSATISGMGFR